MHLSQEIKLGDSRIIVVNGYLTKRKWKTWWWIFTIKSFHWNKLTATVISQFNGLSWDLKKRSDGFQAISFQHQWDLVGFSVINVILEVWSGKCNWAEINRTPLVLIPLVQQPESINNFRPISLCNVTYKILTKVIVNGSAPTAHFA